MEPKINTWHNARDKAAGFVKSPLFSVLALTALFVGVFYKPIFKGACISRIGESALRDGVFRADTLPAPLFPDFDPCFYLWYMPVRDFLKECIFSGKLPFWNPYRCFGYPEFSHPSQSFLNPVLWLSPVTQEYGYCLMLSLQVLACAIGAWLVCRKLSMTPWPSFWAATSFAFSCRILAGLELALFDCFVPFLVLSALHLLDVIRDARAGKTDKASWFTSACMIACVWAFGFLSMHLEVFVISLFVTIAALLVSCFGPASTGAQQKASVPFLPLLGVTAVAGLISLVLVAPVMVPMLKHFGACDFYKLDLAAAAEAKFPLFLVDSLGLKGCDDIPLKTLFAGPLVLLLVPSAGSLLKRVEVRAFAVILFLSLLWTYPTQLSVGLLAHPPFSWLAPQYFLPLQILATCVLSAFGLQSILSCADKADKIRQTLWLFLGSLILGALCIAAGAKPAFGDKGLLFAIIGSAGMAGCIWFPATLRHVLVGVLVVVNLGALLNVDRKILRTNPHIKTAMNLPSNFLQLQNTQDRLIVCGINYFLPNVSTYFRINEVNIADPLAPRGTYKFLQLLGASKLDGFHLNFSRYPAKVATLSGARYFAARGPIVTQEHFKESAAHGGNLKLPNRGIVSGLRVTDGWVQVEREDKQIFGEINFKMHPLFCSYASPKFFVAIVDGSGKVVDSMEPDWAAAMPDGKPALNKLTFALALPSDVKQPRLALKVDNRWTGYTLPTSSRTHAVGTEWTVLSDDVLNSSSLSSALAEHSSTQSSAASWLKLKSTAEGGHRLYEVVKPLSSMYFVANATFADREFGEKLLASKEFDVANSCVLEVDKLDGIVQPAAISKPVSNAGARCNWQRSSNREFEAKVETPVPGYVVFTQAFFPGWNASVDGKPVVVHRANMIFQAVAVPAGSHTVRFDFVPSGLAPGICLFSGGSLFVLSLLVNQRRRRLRRLHEQALQERTNASTHSSN